MLMVTHPDDPAGQVPGGGLAGRVAPLPLLPLCHSCTLPHLPSTLTYHHRHPSMADNAGGETYFDLSAVFLIWF